ncbi:hypothetical protein 7t3_039 [Salmonella phage 7t3]|nr:hypothetical protein 7t3_039 [Salmonella phage 7t3]
MEWCTMNTTLIRPEVLRHVKGRYKGISKNDLNSFPETELLDSEQLLSYGDQNHGYYFDLGIDMGSNKEIGFEGSITQFEFKLVEYTQIDTKPNSVKIDLTLFDGALTEEVFFQFSTIEDFYGLTFEQLRVIIEIRDEIKNRIPHWGINPKEKL